MKKTIITLLVAFAAMTACAQFYGVDINKLGPVLKQAQALPRDNAMIIVKSIMTATEKNPMAFRKTLEFVEIHLGNPADSLHNEDMYLAALEHAAKSYVLSSSEKERPQLLLEMAKKNATGTKAADLEYVTPDGKTHRLSEANGKLTLVYFNDPECDACQQVKQNLDASSVKDLAKAGQLNVVAINPVNNEKKWKKAEFPAWMTNGWDKKQQIENEEVYVMPVSLPVFYLLAADGTVLLKNEPSLKRIEAALAKAVAAKDLPSADLVKLLFNK